MRISRFLTVAGILLVACCTALAEPISVYFSPGSSYKAVGSNFTISILADIPQDPGVVDFGFNLVWDKSMMQLNDVSGASSPWEILWDSGTPESITGLLFPTLNSPESVFGSGTLLATLYFNCLQEGTSTLNIALDPDLFAIGLQGFYGPDGSALDFTVTEGSVEQGTQTVPEPSTLMLLPPALIGLAVWRKRK
jgi:hypothetical protein